MPGFENGLFRSTCAQRPARQTPSAWASLGAHLVVLLNAQSRNAAGPASLCLGGSFGHRDGAGLADGFAKGANETESQGPAMCEHHCGTSLFGVGHLQKSEVRNLTCFTKICRAGKATPGCACRSDAERTI